MELSRTRRLTKQRLVDWLNDEIDLKTNKFSIQKLQSFRRKIRDLNYPDKTPIPLHEIQNCFPIHLKPFEFFWTDQLYRGKEGKKKNIKIFINDVENLLNDYQIGVIKRRHTDIFKPKKKHQKRKPKKGKKNKKQHKKRSYSSDEDDNNNNTDIDLDLNDLQQNRELVDDLLCGVNAKGGNKNNNKKKKKPYQSYNGVRRQLVKKKKYKSKVKYNRRDRHAMRHSKQEKSDNDSDMEIINSPKQNGKRKLINNEINNNVMGIHKINPNSSLWRIGVQLGLINDSGIEPAKKKLKRK